MSQTCFQFLPPGVSFSIKAKEGDAAQQPPQLPQLAMTSLPATTSDSTASVDTEPDQLQALMNSSSAGGTHAQSAAMSGMHNDVYNIVHNPVQLCKP